MRIPIRFYVWAGLEVPHRKLDPHYVVLGTTGSGKTLTIRMLMASVLRSRFVTPRFRAIVYDYKRELYPFLIGMGIPERAIHILQPFDIRGKAWDLAADVTTPAAAYELSTILIPQEEKGGDHPYFTSAAQDVLRGVIGILNEKAPFGWSLNDILELTSTPTVLEGFIRSSAEGKRIAEVYFDSNAKTTASNIISTIRTKLAPYQTIARAWMRASHRVSLTKWARGRGVLLFGADKTVKTALDSINRAMFRRVSQLITSRLDQDPRDETWLFMDEARQLGRLEGLSDLLNEGRSKGAHVVLGFQDLEGFEEVYGERVAREMLGNCGNIAVLKLNNPKTEKWASEYFGSFEYMKRSSSETYGKNASSSVSFSETKKEAVLAQQLHNLPPTNRENGLSGFFQLPSTPPWRTTVPFRTVESYLHPAASAPAFAPRPRGDQEHAPSRFVGKSIGTPLPPEMNQEFWAPDPKDDPLETTS